MGAFFAAFSVPATEADYPAPGDVRDGVSFDTGAQTGTLELPAEADVRRGTQYGAAGTEFEGLLRITSAARTAPAAVGLGSSSLLAAGQRMLAREFPAIITIGHHTYAAATTGMLQSALLEDGGAPLERTNSFWLPLQAFVSAGEMIPTENQSLRCDAPAAMAGEYRIDNVSIDAAGATVSLKCSAQR